MKNTFYILTLFVCLFTVNSIYSQYGDCSNTVDACTNPSFQIDPSLPGNNVVDFTNNNNISNPTTNPNAAPGNSGCLLSGELNPTWLLINVTSNGTLEFSMGQSGSGSCYDWAMWAYTPGTCTGISGNTLPPVACNWNGACGGFTGMANPGNLPAGANQADFEYGLNVTAGQQYIVCFSNYSSQITNVPLNFYGTAQVTCGSGSDAQICFGETATLTATGGVSYNWDTTIPGFIGTNASGTEATMNPTVTTTYPVQVVFANNSTQTLSLVVEVYPQITLSPIFTAETCSGQANGTIVSNAANVVAPATYTLSGTASATNSSGNFSNLAAGSYTITVVDAHGCTGTFTSTIAAGPACCTMVLTASSTKPSCFGECNGTVSVAVTGNTAANTFQWFNAGVAIAGATSNTYLAACAGTYSVQVVDPLCTITAITSVTQPTNLTFTSTKSDLTCFQNASGSISITASGGTPPYQYSDNGSTFQLSPLFNNLAAGQHNIVVKDANGCQKTAVISLTEPAALTATSVITNSLCNIANAPCSGAIQLTTIGGTLPYTFNWSNALPNAALVAALCQNNYSVTITDANGCTLALSNLAVTEPLAVTINTITPINPTCFNYCDGSIEIQATNAVTYTNNGTSQVAPIFSDLCSGNYQIIVADANGCSSQQNITLQNPEPVVANFTFGPQPASIINPEITFENTSLNTVNSVWYFTVNGESIVLNGPTNSYIFPEDEPGNYEVCVIASNLNLCLDTLCQTVIIDDVFFIFVPNAFTPNNDNINDTFFPTLNYFDPNNFEMYIFNRWGEVVFMSESPDVIWDGTHLNTPCEEGVYSWKIRTKVYNSNESKIFTGHVTLVR